VPDLHVEAVFASIPGKGQVGGAEFVHGDKGPFLCLKQIFQNNQPNFSRRN
jgi:hypothetical protein